MIADVEPRDLGSLRSGLDSLHRNWGWYFALGVLLVIFGMVAIGSPFVFTITAVLFFGWLMIASGIIQLVGAFWARYWSGVFLSMLSGLLYIVVGLMTLRHPGTADLALTMLIATFFIVGGLFRIIASLQLRFHGWVWSVLSGAISVLLGGYIYASLPIASLWVIGTLIGVDMLFQGWTWIMLSLAVRTRYTPRGTPATTV